ncbi:MAG TPA: UbiD family decarboxylase, partial [Armatimonadota bacterium]|nr:UbiD family decarboxylase [Armatimonadota bacterium]
IDKQYPHQARKVMHAIWGSGQMMFTKMVVVLDEHVNVQDMGEVIWRLGNNVDWRRDVVIAEGPVDVLDHASPTPNLGGKIGIDATKSWPEEGYPREWPADIAMSAEVVARIDALWATLGIRC